MRLLSLALATPPVLAQGDPLTVSLDYSGVGAPGFAVSKPAYVAIFSVTSRSVRQLYPRIGEQRPVATGRGMSLTDWSGYNWAVFPTSPGTWGYWGSAGMVPSFEYTGGFDDYPYPQSSFGDPFSTGRQTVLVVASTSPLRVDAPGPSEHRIRMELERRGRFLNLDTETGIGDILGIVASSDSNAEQVSTFEDYAISAPFLALGDLMRQRPAFVDCANAWVLNPDYLWYLPKCGLTELARRSPATSPKDTVETRADSTSPLRAGPADRHFISDPTEIRSLLEALRDHPSAGSAATTGPREGRSRDGVAPPDAEPPGRSRALNTGDAPLKGEGARNAGPGEGRPEPSTEVLQHPAGRAETPSEPPPARQPTLPPPPAPSPPAPSPPASSPAAVVPTSPPASPPVRPPGL